MLHVTYNIPWNDMNIQGNIYDGLRSHTELFMKCTQVDNEPKVQKKMTIGWNLTNTIVV